MSQDEFDKEKWSRQRAFMMSLETHQERQQFEMKTIVDRRGLDE